MACQRMFRWVLAKMGYRYYDAAAQKDAAIQREILQKNKNKNPNRRVS